MAQGTPQGLGSFQQDGSSTGNEQGFDLSMLKILARQPHSGPFE